MTTINLFDRWQVKKSWLWWGGGIVAAVVLGLILLAGAAGPRMAGSFYKSIDYDMMESEGAFAYDMSADDGYYEEQAAMERGAGLSPMTANPAQSPQITDRLIIRNGSISMEVENTIATRTRINNLVANMADLGAFVVSSNESGGPSDYSPYINMTIRVPASEFDSVMGQLAEMAVEVRDRNETSDDVTGEYVDLENRIEALESARDRLLEIMQNADTTEDLLQAEAQLTIREAELESLKGRLKYLGESARLSRISISLSPYIPSQPIDKSWDPNKTVRRAIDNLIESVQSFAEFLILFGIAVVPWLVFFGLIIFGIVRWSKRRKTKKEAKSK